jgi:hypothetical protein
MSDCRRKKRWNGYRRKVADIDAVKELLHQHGYQQKNAYEALKNPEVTITDMIPVIPELASYREAIRYQAELEVKYQGGGGGGGATLTKRIGKSPGLRSWRTLPSRKISPTMRWWGCPVKAGRS